MRQNNRMDGGVRRWQRVAPRLTVALALGSGTLALDGPGAVARGGTAPAATPAPVDPGNSENLTVTGHRQHFESAPVPGAPLGPPPDKPPLTIGRYKISGDQEQHDGIDAQTGAQIGAFGTAYTGASPVAQGLAPNHPN